MRMPTGFRSYPLDTTGWVELLPEEKPTMHWIIQVNGTWATGSELEGWSDYGRSDDWPTVEKCMARLLRENLFLSVRIVEDAPGFAVVAESGPDHGADHGVKGGEALPLGCGEMVRVIGTNGGRMPCGAMLKELDGSSAPYLCERCKDDLRKRIYRGQFEPFNPYVEESAESGRKGGASSSVIEPAAPYIGIDYGMGMSNVDLATGIRYGVISQHSLCQEALSDSMEPDYGDPCCPDCGGSVLEADEVKHPALWEARSQYAFDYACLKCRKGYPAMFMDNEPIGMEYSGDGYELVDCLDTDVMVLRSPYYTHAQLCSPCVPGAGNLDNPCPGGPRTFCLGADWFEEGVAPYPVFRVSDNSVVSAAAEEGE